MDEPSSERRTLSPADRLACILFVLLVLGLFVADLVNDFRPVKLTALFVFLFWIPLLVVHEAGHAVMAALLGWRVLGVVLGAGPLLGRLRVGSVPVQVRLVLFEGFVIPAPRSLSLVRLKNALVYFAGPGTELLILVLLVAALGLDTLLTATEDVGLLVARSLAIAILISVTINLVPHPVPRPPEKQGPAMIANDGLGILRSFWMPDAYFADMLHADPDDALQAYDSDDEPI